MLRKIIKIDEEACTGCGICVEACHEGAIALVNGKAKLMRDDYCDGLGDCLPTCPENAIHFVDKDTLEYNEEAVKQHMALKQTLQKMPSALHTWPIQMKLMPLQAAFYQGANIVVAADCTAYAYANFHREFMQDKVVLIGCTKLDGVDYSDKMAEIFRVNDIASIHVVRMEVPCCGGMSHAVQTAIKKSGKRIPYLETIITTEGLLQ